MKSKLILFIGIVFLFSFLIRIWDLNLMGRTWDEQVYVTWGYNFVNLIKHGDFSSPYWYKTSGSPPVSRYLFGVASYLDIEKFDSNGEPIFNYDFTYSRLVSAVFSSLATVLVLLIGWIYVSAFVGITAAIILSMLPLSIGYAQLATLESFILFFFTAVIFSFLNFLKNPSKKNIVLTGIFLGLALGVKYTNILLVPLMMYTFLIWYFQNVKKKVFVKYLKLLLIVFSISFVTFFIIWPMPWFHLQEVFSFNGQLRHSPYSVPEVFFGKLLLVPKAYYLVYFLITTPFLVLVFFILGLLIISGRDISHYTHWSLKSKLLGLKKIFKSRFFFKKQIILAREFFLLSSKNYENGHLQYSRWVVYALIAWFCFPFIQSLYNFRQHGIRYIIEIYAPLSLIAAIGLENVLSMFIPFVRKKYIAVVFVIVYLFLILKSISPYYLDYFNELAGGTNTVFEKRLFQMGWWGQGIREAAYYVRDNAQVGSRVGLALSPIDVMPVLIDMKVSKYDEKNDYDYVIVNYYNIIREGFNDASLKKDYTPVYTVNADHAVLVTVYKKK